MWSTRMFDFDLRDLNSLKGEKVKKKREDPKMISILEIVMYLKSTNPFPGVCIPWQNLKQALGNIESTDCTEYNIDTRKRSIP